MRISDWSSDVCSSDLPPGYTQTNSQISVVTSGNAELQPETSNSLMLGAVWSPSFAAQAAWSDRLDIGVTFYRHTIENAIQAPDARSEEHTSELQSLMRISYAVFCLKKKQQTHRHRMPSPYTH